MNAPAVHMAMRLEKHPEEMIWLCFPDSDLPEGISDLLRLSSSKEELFKFAQTNDLDPDELSTSLYNFIEKAMLNEKNNEEKILGTNKFTSAQTQNFHYQLLMKIYHPDSSERPNADHYSSLIEKTYQKLKETQQKQDVISFSEYRKPSKSYYQASKKTEPQVSNTKTAIAIISAITIISLVTMTGKFYDPANPELVISDPITNTIEQSIVKNPDLLSSQLVKIASIQSATVARPQKTLIQASNSSLQTLLKDLEIAYENGDVDAIKPILANAPETKYQTEKQLNDKLETIFEITNERKMLLFNFDWTTVSETLEGKGKFISRYQLIGENKWLTREGTASVTAIKTNDTLSVTQLMLENQSIE